MAFTSALPMRRFSRCATPFTPSSRPQFIARQVSGRTEPFNENVAQVKRLINRDRKEFLGNADDILDKYTTEFGDGPATTAAPVGDVNPFASASTATPATTATATTTTTTTTTPAVAAPAAATPAPAAPKPFNADSANPFKASAASPFGNSGAPAPKPFKQGIEPRGLSPTMSPDPIVKETPIDFIKSIGIQQIVVFFTFSSMIGLMIATFYVVLNAGGVRLAGLD